MRFIVALEEMNYDYKEVGKIRFENGVTLGNAIAVEKSQ